MKDAKKILVIISKENQKQDFVLNTNWILWSILEINDVNMKDAKKDVLALISQESEGKYCAQHKLDGMFDIKHKKCEHDGCKVNPCFNFAGESKARFCAKHKLDGMFDIKHKKCEHDGCKIRPCYNVEGESKARFCAQHKLDFMVDIKNKRCEYDGCKKQPNYNFEGELKARFCAQHKQDQMIDIKNKQCEHDGCTLIVKSNKYQGFCVRCFMYLFPDSTKQ